MPAINSRCRQWHKPSFLLPDSFRPVFRQVLKSCTFLFFMLSGLLKPHNHPSLIPLISENQPFPAYSLLSFRECSLLRPLSRSEPRPLPCNKSERFIASPPGRPQRQSIMRLCGIGCKGYICISNYASLRMPNIPFSMDNTVSIPLSLEPEVL